MNYVVLLRYGLWRFRAVLKLSRAEDGHISCVETLEPFGGMTWSTGGSIGSSPERALRARASAYRLLP